MRLKYYASGNQQARTSIVPNGRSVKTKHSPRRNAVAMLVFKINTQYENGSVILGVGVSVLDWKEAPSP
jgi:hypothetical protein